MPISTHYECDLCGHQAIGITDDPPDGWTVDRGQVLCPTPRCLAHREALANWNKAQAEAKRAAVVDADRARGKAIDAKMAEWLKANPLPVLGG